MTFRSWFREFDAGAWDCQMVQDAKAEKLDTLANAALEASRLIAALNFEARRRTGLPEYPELPEFTRILADKNFTLLKADSRHPSLFFKKVGHFGSARTGLDYRTVGVGTSDGVL
ncbi:MAG: hypothetical protein ACYCSS_02300 [Sulfuriferula sp.]